MDGIIIEVIECKTFMKNILIFATIASIAIVVAYYWIVEEGDEANEISAF